MKMIRSLRFPATLFLTALLPGVLGAQDKLPREDVVTVPAIGKGLCVSNVFQANMVLQRDKPVPVWGWGDPGEKITVSFAGQSVTATAAKDRTWEVRLEAMEANGAPRVMKVTGARQTLTLENILVGDLWLLGGQSNMEFPIARVQGGPLETLSANFPEIRLLTLPGGKGFDSVHSFERLQEWSSWSSRHFKKGDWEVCTPETVKDFSAIGYVFGRRLHMATRVPIGLIDASIGGTTVETWTPEEAIRKVEGEETKAMMREWEEKIAAYDPKADLERQVAKYEQKKQSFEKQGKPVPAGLKRPTEPRPGPVASKNRPGYLFAGVIRPLDGLAIRGALFHQGYNNCFGGSPGARMYGQVLPKMIEGWRGTFRDKEMPFCIISQCTAGAPQTWDYYCVPMYDVGALLREAQYRTFRALREAGDKGIGFVSSFDLRKSGYHPQIKIPAGERAATWALVTQYALLKGDDQWLPPEIREVVRENGTIRLKMSSQIRTRDDSRPDLVGFAVAGEDRVFHPAKVSYYTDGTLDKRKKPVFKKDVLVLRSALVPNPIHYRYAWARNPMANLVNSNAVSLATQRSDDWILEETPVRFPGSDDTTQQRRIRGLLMKELELADMERRIRDAEATIAGLKEKYVKEREAWEKRKDAELKKGQASGAKSN